MILVTMKILFAMLSGSVVLMMQNTPPDAAALQRMAARFAPTGVTADITSLPQSERSALMKMIDAAKVIDAIFLRQVWAGNEALLLDLLQDQSPLGRARLHYFMVNKGPWS